MKRIFLICLAILMSVVAHIIHAEDAAFSHRTLLPNEQLCEHTATSRHCWGQYSANTNYYTTIPTTGKTVEVWLEVQDGICNQDGYKRPCKTVNGTIPGPAIVADWGDHIIVHVANKMKSNGTSMHWHGVRQLGSTEYDGVPGVSQCPIPPGGTMTYKFRATQYGTGWYHSHLSFQTAEGVFGPLIFNGPATADYEEDLGALFLQDWAHESTFAIWDRKEKFGITHSLSNTLMNGTNTFECLPGLSDSNCVGGGKKFQMAFKHGKRYRIRLINAATDSQFHFNIDGHTLKVIANDFVPIVPYDTDGVLIGAGQRYDIIVAAAAAPRDYWIRGGWNSACVDVANDNPQAITGILRYNDASTKNPTSTSDVKAPTDCIDEPQASLVPYLNFGVTNVADTTVEEVSALINGKALLKWTINSSSLYLDWGNPTLKHILDRESIFPTSYNVMPVDRKSATSDEWVALVIENRAPAALGTVQHPIHLHGHDFWILAQESRQWNGTTAGFNIKNPPRRDVAMLPGGGYLAIAFRLDNPGAWLLHCHIAWHSSEGLALEILESDSSISIPPVSKHVLKKGCKAWGDWSGHSPWKQDDSGI